MPHFSGVFLSFSSQQTNGFGYSLCTTGAYKPEDQTENVNNEAWKLNLWISSLRVHLKSLLSFFHFIFREHEQGPNSDQVSPADIGMINDMLKWVLLVECLRPSIMDVVTITTRITRLLCCFVAGEFSFLKPYLLCQKVGPKCLFY